MEFRYFKNPKQLAAFLPQKNPCSICGRKDKIFDGEPFYGENLIEGVCLGCLKKGRLAELKIYTNDADVEALYEQLIDRHPDTDKETLIQMTKERTEMLEFQTPAVLSWTDWKFPALDGDYAAFVAFGSQALFNAMAADGDGFAFFNEFLHPDFVPDFDLRLLWEQLPKKEILSVEETDHDFLAYLFQSTLHAEKYLILWDSH